ncbi:alpha-hydroxy-acid oxidizing protein [Cupriavidus pauculus]|nr:alpha-hydroxy-acid oxidizing protein [Cupriavidus pauculus]GJG94242.1 hypothetical protein CBA19C6_07155 [Cupriavidus pauculus]
MTHVLTLLQAELEAAMALLGCPTLAALDSTTIYRP